MKLNKKIIILTIIMFFCISGILIYYNSKKYEETISINANLTHVVILEENNCKTSTENNVTILQKYNGSAGTVVIQKEMVQGEALEINSEAFLQCDNLESILIDKSLVSENLKIPNFEVNTNYEDERFVEYTTTQEYSEAYQRYLELTEDEKSKLEVIPSKYDIPMSVLYTDSMEENYSVSTLSEASIPTNYDLREDIDIEVENQGRTGICYSYASLTAVETNLALNHNQYADLSEVHQAMLTGGYGGTFILDSNSYYSENIGPVYENEWPMANLTSATRNDLEKNIYTHLSTSTDYLVGDSLIDVQEILKQTNPKLKVTETVYMPTISKSKNYSDKQIAEARNTIKTHIMNYGSLYASVASKSLIKGTNGHVMNSSNAYSTDHGVSIVGWDDNYAKENFPESCRPEKNGAYLALNSWGESWGNKGYFWISYEDYWAENNLRGVVTVETTNDPGMFIEKFAVTEIDTTKEITDNIVKGNNIQIKIDTIINKLTGGNTQVAVNVISPSGQNITDKISVSGNTIKDYKATVLFDFDTSKFEIGEYTVNIQYEQSIVSQQFTIEHNIFDYYVKDDETIVITKYYGEDNELIIPKEFLGFSITGIANEAFKENNLNSITINENIKECGENIIKSDVIIYGSSGTYIQTYANQNGYIFKVTEEDLIIEFGTNGDTMWKNRSSTTVNVIGNSLDESSLKYKWVQGDNTINESEITDTFINGDEISISNCTGEYYLWILAKDTDGNETIACSNVFYLDNTKPIQGTLVMRLENSDGERYRDNTWSSENVYISINNGEDQHSGHKSTVYRINGGTENKDSQILTESGVYNLEVKTTDNAGNISTSLYTIKIRRIQNIEITSNPIQMEYDTYEDFNLDGMIVSIIYDNGDIEETTNYKIINGEKLTCKSNSVIIQYNDTVSTILKGISVGHAEVIDEGREVTCIQTGLTEGKHCSVCNEVLVEQKIIQAKGHTEVVEIAKEATCTEAGLTSGRYCSVCNEVLAEQEIIPAKGHTEVVEIAKEATCIEAGLTSGKHCSVCNEVLAEQEIIPAKGHIEVINEGTEATCTDTGLTSGKHCSVCNEILVEQEIIPAKGHEFVSYISDENATCVKDGTKTAKCNRCDETDVEVDEGSKLSHNYEKGECINCGEKESMIQIESKEYTIENEKVTRIQSKTTVDQFKFNIETNASEINIYNKKGELLNNNDIIATGMQVELKFENKIKNFTIIISGDVNEDGKSNILDMIIINRARLKRKTLEGVNFDAADVMKDGKVDIKDLVKINRFRLHKITKL